MTGDKLANSSNLSSHPLNGLTDIYTVQRVHFGFGERDGVYGGRSINIAHLRNCDRGLDVNRFGNRSDNGADKEAVTCIILWHDVTRITHGCKCARVFGRRCTRTMRGSTLVNEGSHDRCEPIR